MSQFLSKQMKKGGNNISVFQAWGAKHWTIEYTWAHGIFVLFPGFSLPFWSIFLAETTSCESLVPSMNPSPGIAAEKQVVPEPCFRQIGWCPETQS